MDKKNTSSKKNRSVNFNTDETSLLVNLVNKNKHILFNKETNKVTNELKNATWIDITDQFNAITPRKIQRTKESLVGLWKKTKGAARRHKSFQKREAFATGGGPSQVIPIEIETQAVYDDALAALGDTIQPLYSVADSDTGYHETEVIIAQTFDSVESPATPIEPIQCEEDAAINDIHISTDCVDDPMFKTGSKRRRPVLKSSYERLNTITTKKLDQLSRAENNEDEIMELKRKRFKLEESLSKKHENLIDAYIKYIEEKNRRENEIHNHQLEALKRNHKENFV